MLVLRVKAAVVILGALLTLGLTGGCSSSSDEDLIEEKQSVVTDPVSFNISGISGELLENVNTHLAAIPAISKRRVFIFRRELRETVVTAMRAYGYYNPKIDITLPDREDELDTVVNIAIEQGKPLYVRYCNVEIIGEGADYVVFQNLVKNSGLTSYSILNHQAYEELKSDLSSAALALGFFDASYISSRIMVYTDQNAADIELVYDTGRRYRFGELIASSDTLELMKPVESLYTMQEGRNFAIKTVNDYVNSLNQTGYYRSVDVRPMIAEASDYAVPVEIALERRSDNIMRLGAGFSTDEGARLLFEWDKPLLNDAGHSLSTKAVVSQVTQDASLVYKIPNKNPNLDYFYINASQTHTDLNDTLSDRSHLSFHYVANNTGKWRRDYSLRAEYEDYEQGSDEGHGWNLMPSLLLSRVETTGGFDPRFGYSINLDFSAANSIISDYTFFRFVGTLKSVISPTENTRLITRVQQGANLGADGDILPPSLRFFAGGDNSIRGYGYLDESPRNSGGLNGARYLTTGSVEFQFPIGIDNSRMALFVDAGTATDDYSDEILWGPGFGYRYISPYGTIRVDLGFGMQKDPVDVRLHVAFGPEL